MHINNVFLCLQISTPNKNTREYNFYKVCILLQCFYTAAICRFFIMMCVCAYINLCICIVKSVYSFFIHVDNHCANGRREWIGLNIFGGNFLKDWRKSGRMVEGSYKKLSEFLPQF